MEYLISQDRLHMVDIIIQKERGIIIVISLLLKALLYRGQNIQLSSQEIEIYNNMIEQALTSPDGLIQYDATWPKHRFLHYLSSNKDIVLHGSNNKEIAEFQPKQQTLYSGKHVEAVFASSDGVWPMFYAVLDKGKVVGNFRNGCIKHKSDPYYFFSVSKETSKLNPWTDGMVYVMPSEKFTQVDKGAIRFDEWVSEDPVRPVMKLEVCANDFLMLDKVSVHRKKEALAITYLLYKMRTILRGKSKRTVSSI